MANLFEILKKYSWQSFWLIIASLIINLLALSSALYVIQVLNRYVSYKLDSTLFVLTIGVLIALSFEYILRLVRVSLVDQITTIDHRNFSIATVRKVLYSKLDVNIQNIRSLFLNSLIFTRDSNNTKGAETLVSTIDIIFVGIFISVIFRISFELGLVSSLFIFLYFSLIIINSIINKKLSLVNLEAIEKTEQILSDLRNIPEAIRAFNASGLMFDKFNALHSYQRKIQRNKKFYSSFIDQMLFMIPPLCIVGIIFIGSQKVVSSDITIGALVGINILSSRSFGPLNRFANYFLRNHNLILYKKTAREIRKLEMEDKNGINPKLLRGNIVLQGVFMTFPNSKVALYERLNCNITSGSTIVISGHNGSGKTTFCKNLCGLIRTSKGAIKFDDIEVNKLDLTWLRKNISYLPQEIDLFNLSLRENILINFHNSQLLQGLIEPKDLDGLILTILRKTNLTSFVNSIPNGLDHTITNNGKHFPLGIRKRIGLARSIINDGKVLIMDEPTESLDPLGAKSIYEILSESRKKGKTIIVATHDTNIINNADAIIDLSSKPIPRIGIRKKHMETK